MIGNRTSSSQPGHRFPSAAPHFSVRLVMRHRTPVLTSFVVATFLAVVLVVSVPWGRGRTPVGQRIERFPTNLYRVGLTLIDGLPDRMSVGAWRLRGYLAVRYLESHLQDIEAAADDGIILKRIDFVRNKSFENRGLDRILRTWVRANGEDVWLSTDRLVLRVYVSASAAGGLERYLSSLGVELLNLSE